MSKIAIYSILVLGILSGCVNDVPPAEPVVAVPKRAPTPRPDANFIKLTGHWDAMSAAAISADGRMAVTGSDDMTIRLWDLTSRKERLRLQGHAQPVSSVAISPDGSKIASGSNDTRIVVWDASSGRELNVLNGHTQFVSALAFTPDGQSLLSGSHDGTVRIWSLGTGKLLRKLVESGKRKTINAIAVSNDGRVAIAGDDKSVQVWDLKSGKLLRRLLGHAGWVTCVEFSGDGARLVTGSADRTARLWDVSTGQEIRRYVGANSPISRVKLVASEAVLIAGGGAEALVPDPDKDDFAVRAYRVTDGAPLATFKGHKGPVAAIFEVGDGKTVRTVALDETVRDWTLPKTKAP